MIAAAALRGYVDSTGTARCKCGRAVAFYFQGEGRFRCPKCGKMFWVNSERDQKEMTGELLYDEGRTVYPAATG